MFNKNTYLLPQVSSPFHPRTTNSLVDLNGVEILLHHHPDVFSGHYLAPTNTHVPDQSAITLINPHDCAFNGDPSPIAANAFQRKQTVKKDRHSKIFTAQGPRDRRVRLSIGIARKFFDLQEMLDFDKPSKTLDWLLTKSKTAIKELVQMKQKSGGGSVKSSSSPNSECEVLSCAENGNSFGEDSKVKLGKKGKDSQNLVKESRAKARARARERTREKMCIKQLNGGGRINTGSDLNPSINISPIQFKNNQLELSAGSCSNNPVFHCHEAVREDLIQESIVIKRKSKNPSFFGFSSSNYGVPSANGSENWDICAILDQHKFINSSSNI